jgi:nucleotide-binding universal stress UspA family protein
MKHILATTDFSKAGDNALHYAAALAVHTKCKLHVTHATHIPVVNDSFFDISYTLEELKKSDEERMTQLIDVLRKKFGPELKLEKETRIGFTTEVIKEKVKSGDVQLVVMGIAPADRLSELTFGSTSTLVAGQLHIPVLIVPDGVKFRPWTKLAFTFDQKNVAAEATGIIKFLTKPFGTALHFVNVQDEPLPHEDDTMLKPLFKALGEKAPRVHYLKYVPNSTVMIIQDWARRYKATAIAMIAREHSIFWKMLHERTTKKMAFHTKVPLLVIPERLEKKAPIQKRK